MHRRHPLVLLSLCGLAVMLGALVPAHGQSGGPTPSEIYARFVNEARLVCARVNDYTATFIKQEQVAGKLMPEQMALMKVRHRPFAVHLKFVAPSSVANQEACFNSVKSVRQMRAKAGGLLSAMGFVSLDLNDRRAMSNNRHTLDEAGLSNLLDKMATRHAVEGKVPTLHARFAEYQFHKRACTRAETIHTRFVPGAYAYRCVTYFDKETRLPVRFEAYDWPRAGGEPTGDLLECYSYLNVKLNAGLTDADFNY